MANKTIRNFLLAYSPSKHPEIIKLVALYGILNLQQHFGPHQPSSDDIRKLVKTGSISTALDNRIGGIQSSMHELHCTLADIAREVDDPAARPAVCSSPSVARLTSPCPVNSARLSPAVDDRADGLCSGASKLSTHSQVHPGWWHQDSNGLPEFPQGSRAALKPMRPPPRLSYSQLDKPAPDPTCDDLAMPQFALVPPTASLHTPRSGNTTSRNKGSGLSDKQIWR
ncbi:hypothetical protein WJX73_009833 [Symbiochloris irregularis]|uniref:Uncharacterized protein n=1 Tax=Symbiochloris irregularis TaxID=706552 RepID=A0AAW1PF52_9CHLO